MSTATDPTSKDGTARVPVAGTTGGYRTFAFEEMGSAGFSLGTRFFLAAAALLAFTLGVTLGLANWRARGLAEERIREDLTAVPEIFEGYRDAQGSSRRGQVRSLADEPGTKALVAETGANPETFHDTAQEFARGLGAGIVFLFDGRGALISRSDRQPGEEAGRDFSEVSWVDTPLHRMGEASAFILDVRGARALFLVASAPVVQGSGSELQVTGVLAGAFPVNQERARELARLTNGEIAFLGNVAPRGAPPKLQVVAASDDVIAADVAQRLGQDAAALSSLFGKGTGFGPLELRAAGEEHIATALPILSGGGEPIAALVVARSKAAEMAAFRRLQEALLAVGGLVLLGAVPISYLLARSLSRPIRELARAAEEVGRGQLEVRVREDAGGEVGGLARAFMGMVSELKAKAELERMIAEMQRRPGDVTLPGARPRADAEVAAPPGLEVGRLFANRYLLLSRLGEGGMGTVFRAQDRELDDEVALKALKLEVGGDVSLAEPLRHEIKLARMITHPNVVRAHDFGEHEGVRFLTMEYVPGTTLRELLDQHGALELTPGLQIAKQICRGLAAVHKARIIHGDLKPQNVMVMGNGVAKLMDFGVARARAAQQSGAWVGGTPRYMSPEQARGAAIDERSDLYAMGVVTFEMFTGRCPFNDPDVFEVLRMQQEEAPPDPRRLRPDLPESLAQIVLTCLAKTRLHRPASAAELERMLMRVRV